MSQAQPPAAAPGFYRVLLWLAVPFALLRLWWRGRQQPGYRQHIGERFGYVKLPAGGPIIWLHAVSVGETRASEPLIHALLAAYPTHRILLTHMTPTGRATSASLYADLIAAGRLLVTWLPYDLCGAVDRFLRRAQPVIGLLMETEIWPNLILRSRRQGLPILLINARLSARSARRYARFARFVRPVLAALTATGAQSAADAERLRQLGADPVHITGNLKFDVRLAPKLQALGRTWRSHLPAPRPVWLTASSRDGEEAIILAAQRELCARLPDLNPLLIIVPRHPQRFDDVAAQIDAAGFRLARRSAALPDAQTQVWLGDSMGEMVAYYSLADVSVIGGSLLPFGGQNLIEAAACGTPLIIGPHTYNFTEAANAAEQCGTALRLNEVSPQALADAVAELLTNAPRRQQAIRAAAQFVAAATGATEKTRQLIADHLPD